MSIVRTSLRASRNVTRSFTAPHTSKTLLTRSLTSSFIPLWTPKPSISFSSALSHSFFPSQHTAHFSASSTSKSNQAQTFTKEIDSTKLKVELTNTPKKKLPKEELKFGATTSDHMLVIDWAEDKGWTAPKIIPYQNLSLDPASSVFHYAIECFEGLKAYMDEAGNMRLFRADKNMERINRSAARLGMPKVDKENFLECIRELVRTDRSWIPQAFGYSLYIRPTYISTYAHIGVAPTKNCKLYVICSPVGPYYATGWQPVKLLADQHHVRAWPGGTGDTKAGANYALGIKPGQEAIKKGCAQVLWLFGEKHEITEVGTMNMFFFWQTKTGRRELITAPLDGTILHGVTRDSILQLCRDWNEFDVVERKFTLDEVLTAIKEGRLIEAFGAGTAAIVAPVNGISWKDKDYPVPLSKEDPKAKAGILTQRLLDTILGIQYGKIPHKWSTIIN